MVKVVLGCVGCPVLVRWPLAALDVLKAFIAKLNSSLLVSLSPLLPDLRDYTAPSCPSCLLLYVFIYIICPSVYPCFHPSTSLPFLEFLYLSFPSFPLYSLSFHYRTASVCFLVSLSPLLPVLCDYTAPYVPFVSFSMSLSIISIYPCFHPL